MEVVEQPQQQSQYGDDIQQEASKMVEYIVKVIITAFDKSVNENAISEFLLQASNFVRATYEIIVALRTMPEPQYQWHEQSSLMFVAKYITIGKMEDPRLINATSFNDARRFPGALPNIIINNLAICRQSAAILDKCFKNIFTSMYNNIIPLLCGFITKYMTMCNNVAYNQSENNFTGKQATL